MCSSELSNLGYYEAAHFSGQSSFILTLLRYFPGQWWHYSTYPLWSVQVDPFTKKKVGTNFWTLTNILRLDIFLTKFSNWIITLLVRYPSSPSFVCEDEAEDIMTRMPLKSGSKNFPLAIYKPMVVLLARISFCRNTQWGFGYHLHGHWCILSKSDQLITN